VLLLSILLANSSVSSDGRVEQLSYILCAKGVSRLRCIPRINRIRNNTFCLPERLRASSSTGVAVKGIIKSITGGSGIVSERR